MSRNRLLMIAGGLALAATVSLISGIVLVSRDVGEYIAGHYQQYARDANAKRYLCTGTPHQVADTLAHYKTPSARAADGGNEYLRYSDYVVIVGPDGTRPCSIRVEDLGAGYRHGSYVFLGPGFTPGSPSGGSGGSPGGPGGAK
ncbi:MULTISPECIES: DUF4247 domain-containing protein [Mycobacterium]|uniref:DUF4247 domain-containing protein n=1 Tax=Mycobacterium gordonae TaxID=1778 RepID=A0A1A6BGF5_MYCGO|nr:MULTISPECIES: DUF4247 domain-containing protein [Mycobacterium]MBI2698816.1 DUF4247 domain-containing protein [Mycobacterium sp.]MBX9978621.1 DUF4247 domain-containing protein [Mycobacterium gordonae]MCQ4365630.1 DUF4247 domain-containing protein [Mycobacterium gordonae]MCV7008289.1 DUF4247 domain-containing protein [Mycobacterium gordonae]OBS01403.1 hypothetical protein A9W98_20345 [Mycobacterium gordonae]